MDGSGGGAGTQRREMAVGGVKAPQPSGRWGKGPLSTRDLARLLFDSVDCPSICSLWRWRGSALRLFNSFSIFFQHWKNNFLKLWFKKKKIIWLEGREKGNTKSCTMMNWRYLTGALSRPRQTNSFLDSKAAEYWDCQWQKAEERPLFLPFSFLLSKNSCSAFPASLGLPPQWPLGLPFHVCEHTHKLAKYHFS